MTPAKRILDVALAAPLAIGTLPLLATVAIANRLSGDRGPLLYRAVRVGEGGRQIVVYKLRTMRTESDGGALTLRNDPRVTSVGRVLRRHKLDELPQVWNVLRGDMSLVGPRPEDPSFVDWADPLHASVFRARPGMTGLAQLAFVDEERMHAGQSSADHYRDQILPRKLRLDRWYLDREGIRLDARILLRTARLLVGGSRRRR